MKDMLMQCLVAGIVLGGVYLVLYRTMWTAVRQRAVMAFLAAIIVLVLAFATWEEAPRLWPMFVCFYTVLAVGVGTGELLVPFLMLTARRRDKPEPTK
jgi:hydrogenase-4 membrane subunit HyfE